jgi:hypothetical protein
VYAFLISFMCTTWSSISPSCVLSHQ